MLSAAIIGTMTSSDFLRSVSPDFAHRAYTGNYLGCGPRTAQDLPCSIIYCHNIPLPLRRWVLGRLRFRKSSSPSLVFADRSPARHPLAPLFGANITTLQDSLYGTDCCFAPVSHRDTSLQHDRSPGSTGSLLRGPSGGYRDRTFTGEQMIALQGTRAI